jgi:hypothetical protein
MLFVELACWPDYKNKSFGFLFKPNEDAIIAAKEAVKAAWLGRSGVTGMDVGFKYVRGKRTAHIAIRLFVRNKKARVASAERFPRRIGKHKTDVIESDIKLAGPPDGNFYNPVVGGVQLVENGFPYTSGMFVSDNTTDQLMILGTGHGFVPPNSSIFQPSGATQPDGSNGNIGYLIRGGHHLTQPVDSDLFSFGCTRGYNFIIEGLGCVKGVNQVGMSDLGIAVTKRGRTTGVTHGTLDGFSFSFLYPPDYQGNRITYDNMLTFGGDPTTNASLGQGGDSGSIILDGSMNAVALLTVVGGNLTYGPAIPDILTALKVTPCFCDTILPRKITLTSSEFISGPWGPSPSVSGVDVVKSPGGIIYAFKWTVTNVYSTLTFHATVVGFNQPVFSWKIGGKKVNDFNNIGSGSVTFQTLVWKDKQISPITQGFDEEVTLQFSAEGNAQYDVAGTFATLGLNPTEVLGHIAVTVEVTVQDAAGTLGPQSATASLDTQILTYL